jgi:hypothetical protein
MSMATYTKDDYDIKKMDINDRIDYDINFLNYDLEANRQLNTGLTLLKDIRQIKNDPIGSINFLLILFLFIALLTLLLTGVICNIIAMFSTKVEYSMYMLGKLEGTSSIYWFVCYIILLLILFYYIYNKVQNKFYMNRMNT